MLLGSDRGALLLLGSDRGALLGRRPGGVTTLPASVTTRGAALNALRDRLTETMLCCSAWRCGAGGSAPGSSRRRVAGADTAE
jgi:hypothetical protein